MRVWHHVLLVTSLSVGVAGCRHPPADAGHASSAPALAAPIPRFTDHADRAGLHFRHVNGGSGHYYYPEIYGPGCALFDYDNDGWLDVYLVQGAPMPGWQGNERFSNKLYHNNHDGTFTDVTDKAGVTGIINGRKAYGMGCAVGDFDNDGYEDLLVTSFGQCILYHNNGNGTFTDITKRAGLAAPGFYTSALFLDYNNDGYLDLFICHYIKYQLGDDIICQPKGRHRDYCPPGFFPAAQSALYRNNGNGTFTDVTRAAGVVSKFNKALAAVAADFNGDGWPDLYVACDMTPNLLYINQGNGTFRETAVESGVAYNDQGHSYDGMGADAGDYDNDGRPDIVVANYWLQGVSLYHNLDGQLFTDMTQGAGLSAMTMRKVQWGVGLEDFNNDTHLDCFLAAGHVLLYPEQATPGAEVKQTDQLLLNLGGGKFRDVSAQAGPCFREKRMARGAAFGDVLNNGAIDVLVAHNNDKPALLMNDGGKRLNWLTLRLVGRKSNRDGLGAKVYVTVQGQTLYHEVHSGYSYLSSSDKRAHFGLGAAEFADTVRIVWPSRQVDTLQHVNANQILTVNEK